MDSRLMTLEEDILNYNKVKDIVVNKICGEGYMTGDEANEFKERNQVLLYKGNWFSKWFEKNISTQAKDKETYYIRMVSMSDKVFDTKDTSIRNRKIKAGVYRNVFKRLLQKDYPEIMDKHEVDFSEVIFHSTEAELLDCMNIIFKDHEMMERYEKDHKQFLDDADNIARTIGFENGVILTIQD